MKKLFFVVLMIASAITSFAQMPPIPVDTDVRIGKLPNGLTYYIRHNNWPENRAEFYIAQRVGSIQEEDSQRGLAHFLEHMCFNGTKHFPGDGIIRYCESIGVKFGADLNAYTAIDETVYNISNVPTNNINNIDSCLLILSDWADGLLLETEETQECSECLNATCLPSILTASTDTACLSAQWKWWTTSSRKSYATIMRLGIVQTTKV